MKDGITNGNGDSRYLKSAIPANTTHEQMVELLRSGTFPVDFNGINASGWEQLPTWLNKATLLTDETAGYLGVKLSNPVVNDAFTALGVSHSALFARAPCIAETRGTGSAFIAAISEFEALPPDGIILSLRLHADSVSGATLNVNNTGAKPIINSAGIPIDAGLITGSFIAVTYTSSLDTYIILGGGFAGGDIQSFTSSGTFAAPKTGYYKITCVGAGGGYTGTATARRIVAGGGGGTGIKMVWLEKGDTVAVTVSTSITSFGSYCSGSAGSYSVLNHTSYSVSVPSGGAAVGDISVPGSGGLGSAIYYSAMSVGDVTMALGGNSLFGFGGVYVGVNATSTSGVTTSVSSATGYGGGAGNGTQSAVSATLSSNATAGICVVEAL